MAVAGLIGVLNDVLIAGLIVGLIAGLIPPVIDGHRAPPAPNARQPS